MLGVLSFVESALSSQLGCWYLGNEERVAAARPRYTFGSPCCFGDREGFFYLYSESACRTLGGLSGECEHVEMELAVYVPVERLPPISLYLYV